MALRCAAQYGPPEDLAPCVSQHQRHRTNHQPTKEAREIAQNGDLCHGTVKAMLADVNKSER